MIVVEVEVGRRWGLKINEFSENNSNFNLILQVNATQQNFDVVSLFSAAEGSQRGNIYKRLTINRQFHANFLHSRSETTPASSRSNFPMIDIFELCELVSCCYGIQIEFSSGFVDAETEKIYSA